MYQVLHKWTGTLAMDLSSTVLYALHTCMGVVGSHWDWVTAVTDLMV